MGLIGFHVPTLPQFAGTPALNQSILQGATIDYVKGWTNKMQTLIYPEINVVKSMMYTNSQGATVIFLQELLAVEELIRRC